MGCKAPRQRWHSWQPRQRSFCKLQNLKELAEFDTLPADVRENVRARLGLIQVRAHDVGWGFGDAVDELVHALGARAARVRSRQG